MWFKSKKKSLPDAPAAVKKPTQAGPAPANSAMQNVNAYHRELTAEQIAKGEHRHFVGAMWEEVGLAQLEFLRGRGFMPGHQLCDIGCGALRAGIHFAGYLDAGHYHGMDINTSLINAGRMELEGLGLSGKNAHLLVDDAFAMSRFETKFDFIVAASLFTHLYGNHIVRCLVEARKVLAPGGQFLATFFRAPASAHLESIKHEINGAVTLYDRDPFHQSIEEMAFLGGVAGLKTEFIGKWGPWDQQMLLFTLP